MKCLIVFYSLSGNTKFIAESMAAAVGADLLELKILKPIEGGGFMKYFLGGRQAIKKEKPELLPLGKNIADYDMLIIGTPVWAFTFTPAIRSFLTNEKITSKKIALFCCCDGMPGKTLANIKKEIPENEFIGEIIFEKTSNNREKNKEQAVVWINSLKLNNNPT